MSSFSLSEYLRNPKNPGADPMPVHELAGYRLIEVTEGSGDKGDAAGFEMSKRSVLYVMFRHLGKIALSFILVSAATVWYVSQQPDLYESEARVLIRGDRNNIMIDPAAEGNSLVKSSRIGGNVIGSEIGIITSEALAETVVNRIGEERILSLASASPENPPLMGGGGHPGADPAAPENSFPFGQKARGVAHNVIDALNLRQARPGLHSLAVGFVRNNLKVGQSMGGSDILILTFKSRHPESSQEILQALVAEYEQKHIAVHKSPISPDFFRGMAASKKTALDAKELELEQLTKKLDITSLENEKNLLLNQQNALATSLVEARSEMSAADESIRVLESFLKKQEGRDGKKTLMPLANPMAVNLQNMLTEKQIEEAVMSAKYPDTNPDLISLRTEIKSIESKLKSALDQPSTVEMPPAGDQRNPQFELALQLEKGRGDKAAMAAKQRILQSELEIVNAKITKIVENETAIRNLERQIAVLEEEYKQYRNSEQAAAISSTLDKDSVSNVSVVQPATLPYQSTKSQRKMLALLGFGIFLGLGIGMAWAFGLEFLDHTLKTNDDIERHLGLSVLISIPATKHHLPVFEGTTDV